MANKKQPKNITLSSLKQQNKKYEEIFEIEIDGYNLKINKFWSPTKISELMIEFANNLRETHMDDRLSSAYMYLLLLRYFTSLSIPDDFSKQMDWLNELVDSGYLNTIVTQLPEDQMELVSKELQTATENMAQNLISIQEQLDNQDLENEEVKNMILNTTSEKSE